MTTNTIRYDIEIQQAQRALQSLENSTKSLHNTFSKFGAALSGLAIGAFIGQSARMADNLSDTAKAANISTQALIGFSKALAANGGEFASGSDAILKFNEKLGDAIQGNEQAQNAFAALNVSIEDLKKLTSEELLNKVLFELGSLTDKSLQASRATDVFGKTLKGVDASGLANDVRKLTEESQQQGEDVKAAADAVQALETSYKTLQFEVLSAIKPIATFTAELLQVSPAVKAVAAGVVEITAALAGFAILASIGAGLSGLSGVLGTIGAGMAAIAAPAALVVAGLLAINTAIKAFSGKSLIDFATEIAIRMGIMSEKTNEHKKAAEGNTQASEKEADALRMVTDASIAKSAALREIVLGYQDQVNALKRSIELETKLMTMSESQALANRAIQELESNYLTKRLEIEKQIRLAQDESMKGGAKSAEQKKNDANKIQELNKQLQVLTDTYEIEVGTLGDVIRRREEAARASSLLKFQQEQVVNSFKEFNSIIAETHGTNLPKLQREYLKVTEAARASADAAILAENIRRGPNNQLTPEEAKAYYDAAYKGASELIPAIKALNEAETEREYRLESDRQRNFLASEYQKILDDTAKLTMTEIEKKEYDIAAAARDRAKAFIEAEEARTGVKIDEQEQQRIISSYIDSTKDLVSATKDSYNQSRSFATGWKQAMTSYVSDVTNGANKAKDVFGKAMRGMEDLIVNFAKTGKFEFKNFVAMMLEELLRAQIQALFAQMLGGMSQSMQPQQGMNMGQLAMAGQFGMQGQAFGGQQQNPVGSIIKGVVGGIGSLFSSGDKLSPDQDGPVRPDGFGTQFVNQAWQGITETTSSIWSGISDLGSSISDSFSGFFAEGGNIPSGKWGIAGELGPEIISGPASVTPMSGSGGSSSVTNVNYHISAVDAMSFKQLVASDPGFIHAVASAGAKGISGRR